MINPFLINIVQGDDFCDRKKELKDLKRYAVNGQNVVLYSPRRYGKSSLVRVLFSELNRGNSAAIYVDLFSVTSYQDVVSKVSKAIIEEFGKDIKPLSFRDRFKSIFTRFTPLLEVTPEGLNISVKFDADAKMEPLIEDIFKGLYKYVEKNRIKLCFALDEFQEITRINESKKLEGLLRSHIQLSKNVSFFFIGSRRSVLKNMFTDRNRPFYKSAFLYELPVIPENDFVPYITGKFRNSGKECPEKIARKIYAEMNGYPYYVQKLSYLLWDVTEKTANDGLVAEALRQLVKMESVDFENIWNDLALTQKILLKSLAKEPTAAPFSRDYMKKYGLSIGGIQKAIVSLTSKDLIEKDGNSTLRIVDPLFLKWLIKA